MTFTLVEQNKKLADPKHVITMIVDEQSVRMNPVLLEGHPCAGLQCI